jgi:hypothetical protein
MPTRSSLFIILVALCVAPCVARPPDATESFLRGPTCGSVLIRWSTHERSHNDTFSLAPRMGAETKVELVAEKATYKSGRYASPTIWSYLAEGLTPGAAYNVELWQSKDAVEFLVPACAPATEGVPSELFIFGDTGRGDTTLSVMNAMRAHLRPAGSLDTPSLAATSVLLLGDLSYANGRAALWDDFQKKAQPLFSSGVPVAVLPGSHDFDQPDDVAAYSARFANFPAASPQQSENETHCIARLGLGSPPQQPVPGMYASFASGLIHVIYLCEYMHCTTGSTADLPLGDAQSAWLREELACRVHRDATPFLVVALHAPLYHSHTKHANDKVTKAVRSWLEPLLLSYKADAVIAGHVHAFEVTHPMAYGALSQDDGIHHVTVGTGGVSIYNTWQKPTPPWSVFRNGKNFGYASLRAVNRTHALLTQVGLQF